jgi:hypothetical protein
VDSFEGPNAIVPKQEQDCSRPCLDKTQLLVERAKVNEQAVEPRFGVNKERTEMRAGRIPKVAIGRIVFF